MSDAKKCDRCRGFYSLDFSDEKDNVAGIATLDKYGRIVDRLDLCQKCREEFNKWLETPKEEPKTKRDPIQFVIHALWNEDIEAAYNSIYNHVSLIIDTHLLGTWPNKEIDLPGIDVIFRCGTPDLVLGGLKPNFYMSNSEKGVECLGNLAKAVHGIRLRNMQDVLNEIDRILSRR